MNLQANQSAPRRWAPGGVGLGAIGLLALVLALGPVTDGRAQSAGGYMGVTLQDMDDELRRSYRLDRSDGVLVSDVQAEGPADQAGIRRGDILLRVAGQTVSSTSDVIDKVRGMSPGETAVVTVWRDSREQTFRVALTERPHLRSWTDDDDDRPFVYEWKGKDGEPHVFEFRGDPDDIMGHGVPMPDVERLRDLHVIVGSRARLGVRTQDLNDQLGAYFQAPDGKGVLVLEVLEDTPAEKAGIAAGDVIVSVDGEPVETTSDLSSELRKKDDGAVGIELIRRGSRQTLTAQLEKRDVEGWSMRLPRAPRAPRAYRHSPRGNLHLAPPPAADRLEMERDMERLRREMRDLERDMEELRRELRRDGS